jgi:hypothetical protein
MLPRRLFFSARHRTQTRKPKATLESADARKRGRVGEPYKLLWALSGRQARDPIEAHGHVQPVCAEHRRGLRELHKPRVSARTDHCQLHGLVRRSNNCLHGQYLEGELASPGAPQHEDDEGRCCGEGARNDAGEISRLGALLHHRQ